MRPFLYDRNLLRVGGRLQRTMYSNDRKHPVILSKHSRLTTLIILDIHAKHLHCGVQYTLDKFGRKYWITGVRRVIRNILTKCVSCRKGWPVTSHQLMGDLPAVRATLTRPFLKTGVDYAGPIPLRLAPGRGQRTTKGFIAVFVCMATKAVHLELVSSLSTDAFLAALRRFCSRRGLCQDIYSDNGTNFVGAARQLSEMHQLLSSPAHQNQVQRALSREQIQWHFIPPGAPHFGGLWEAAVKLTKRHLKLILQSTTLTFEELTTLLCQIESLLNSRPLTPFTTDLEDCDALTPGHFLVGHPLTEVPDLQCDDASSTRLSRWQSGQRLLQHFTQ